jgi:hypothetical protein
MELIGLKTGDMEDNERVQLYFYVIVCSTPWGNVQSVLKKNQYKKDRNKHFQTLFHRNGKHSWIFQHREKDFENFGVTVKKLTDTNTAHRGNNRESIWSSAKKSFLESR